jgi:membrane protein DedA with SNARE-associated domain
MFFNRRFLVVAAVAAFLTVGGLQLDGARSGVILPQQAFGQGSTLAAAAGMTFDATVSWVKEAGYIAIFIAMLVEGPIITAAAAFGAALGYFDIGTIFILSLLGDLTGDLIYYVLGYWGRIAFVERFGHRFGLTKKRMKKLEHLLHTHPTKTLLFIKLAPVLPTPGLMLVGALKMPLVRFVVLSLLITLPKTLVFMALGYYFGSAYDSITAYAQTGAYFMLLTLVAVVGVYWMYQKGSEQLAYRLQGV